MYLLFIKSKPSFINNSFHFTLELALSKSGKINSKSLENKKCRFSAEFKVIPEKVLGISGKISDLFVGGCV